MPSRKQEGPGRPNERKELGELDALKGDEARDLLSHCVSEGAVIPSKHFREALADENLDMASAYQVLKGGSIYDPSEQDAKTREWKYRVEGREPDGKWLAIVFCFKELKRPSAFLITCFSVKRLDR